MYRRQLLFKSTEVYAKVDTPNFENVARQLTTLNIGWLCVIRPPVAPVTTVLARKNTDIIR